MGKIRRTSRLKFLATIAPAMAQKALLQTGKDVLALSQQLVPVDTGSLKKSGGVMPVSSLLIHVGYGGAGVYYSGREPEKYAHYVELGTVQHPPQPYLRPALMHAQDTMEQRVKEEVEKLT